MSESQIDFSGDDNAAVKELPVRNLLGRSYVLREATDDTINRWKKSLQDEARIGADGKPTRIPLGTEATLVSLCLFDAEGKAVPVATVRGWPHRVVQRLFKAAVDLSGVSARPGEGEEKNDG